MRFSLKTEDSATSSSPEIKEDGIITTKNGPCIRTITISGQIEGHTMLPQGTKSTRYELLIPQLVEIEESEEIDGLLLIINTVGGDVEAGLAIAELVSGLSKPSASLVIGGGHSIGVPLAVCANRSFIVPSATMTLHPVRVSGTVLGAPQTSEMFRQMQERISNFICKHSKVSEKRLRELIFNTDEMATDIGSVLNGEQAVREGLIDGIGTLRNALDYIKNTINR